MEVDHMLCVIKTTPFSLQALRLGLKPPSHTCRPPGSPSQALAGMLFSSGAAAWLPEADPNARPWNMSLNSPPTPNTHIF